MAEASVAGRIAGRTQAIRKRARRAARRAARQIRDRARPRPATSLSGPNSAPVGLVEDFQYWQIMGWVIARDADLPAKVTLHVNDLQVASTWADEPSERNTWSQARGFRIEVHDLWKYCQQSDRVTVRLDGQALPIAQKGIYKRPANNSELGLADLRRKFDAGYIFGQTGRLQLSKKLDIAWQRSVIGLYERISAVVNKEFGYDPFVIYGSLLGLVREGGFIGHDVDFDASYISRHRDGAAAAQELRDIAFALVDAGMDVECKRTALHIHDNDDSDLRIDLFHLYFDDNGDLAFPFGVAGQTKFTRADWSGLASSTLGGATVLAPKNPEKLVEYIYGPSWRTPIAGFNWDRSRTAWRKDGWMPNSYAEEVYWANFYARHELTAGSTFFDAIAARDDIPRTVLDIGCGDGRDTFAFARAGCTTIGMDRSHVGIRHAAKKADEDGLGSRLSFVAGDVSDATAVKGAVAQAREASSGGPVLFYLRFFLHSIPEDVQQTLMSALAEAAQDGDVFAAEFRTDKDEANQKVFGKHYRRFQNGAEFGRSLSEQYGFTIVHEEEGTGLAPYQDEDPVLYRVVATRGDVRADK